MLANSMSEHCICNTWNIKIVYGYEYHQCDQDANEVHINKDMHIYVYATTNVELFLNIRNIIFPTRILNSLDGKKVNIYYLYDRMPDRILYCH